MHDVADELEHGAEPAARMQTAEVDGGEAAALQKRDRQRIAERGLHQGGGGGGEIVRTGFARLRQRQHHVGRLTERAVGRCRDGDQADAEAARIVDQVLELGGLSRPRQRHDHVVGRDHAEIAMACFARVDEKGGGAGGSESGRDLARDVAGLAHPGHDQATVRARDQFHRRDESVTEPVMDGGGKRGDAGRLGLERPHRRGDQVAWAGRIFAAQRLLHTSGTISQPGVERTSTEMRRTRPSMSTGGVNPL